MARKGTIHKFIIPGSGSADESFRAELGTNEAGNTVIKINVGVFELNGARYTALSAAEKVAFRAVTLGDIIDAAFHQTVEI